MKGATLVEWIRLDGVKQRGKMYAHEQAAEFKAAKKSSVHLLNDDLTDKKDSNGRKMIGLVATEKLKVFGFID